MTRRLMTKTTKKNHRAHTTRPVHASRAAGTTRAAGTNRAAVAASVLALLLVGGVTLAGLDEGVAAFKAKKYAEAQAEFQALVDENETYDYGWFMLGNSLLQQKKLGEAEEMLVKAVELNGDRFDYHYTLAQTYYKQKKHGKAIAQLKMSEGLAESPQFKYALYNLRGMAYYNESKWSEAIGDLEKSNAIRATPTATKAIGLSYYNLGYYDKALPTLEKAASQAPKDTNLTMRVATAHLNQGASANNKAKKKAHYGKALTFAKKYRDEKPTAEGHNLVGRAALGAENFPEAEGAFKEVLKKDSKHCYAMANLGKTYIAMQRWSDAESSLTNATKCSGKLGVAYENLGFALQKQKRYQDALQAYKKAYEIEPKPAIKGYIDTTQKQIDTEQFNKEQDALAKKQAEDEAKARAEFEAEQKKLEEYKKKQEDN